MHFALSILQYYNVSLHTAWLILVTTQVQTFPVPLKTFRPELEILSVNKYGGTVIQPALCDSLRTHYLRADSFL